MILLDEDPEELKEDEYLRIHAEPANRLQHFQSLVLEYFNLLSASFRFLGNLKDHVDEWLVFCCVRHFWIVVAYENDRSCLQHSIDKL